MPILPGRIPVKLNPLFLVLIGLIGWLNSNTIEGTLIWCAVIFISVLVHEFGHALTAIAFGQEAEIELYGMGGVTKRQGPPIKLWQEFLIVLNGPLAGLALFFFAFEIWNIMGLNEKPMNLWLYALQITIYVNLFWTIVNLMPVHPLDGGHLLRIMLEGLFGTRGIKIAMFISMSLAGVLALLFFKIGALIIGVIFLILTFESYRSWQSAMSLTDHDRDTEIQNNLKNAETAIRSGNYQEALRILTDIRKKTKSGIIYRAATEYTGQVLNEQGLTQEAYDLLKPVRKQLSPEGLSLLHQLAYKLGQWEDAIDLGNTTFQYYPNYQTAVLNALSHAALGQVEPALGWLQTALSQGLPNLSEVLKKREFDHMRNDPQFQHLLDQSNNV
jgi:Zn-dependent protease